MICWTTCLLNIGPFARCWMPLCLSNVIGHFVPQDSLSYKTQWPLRLIRRERRSPEVTVNYITEDETIHHLLFSWRPDHQLKCITSGEESQVDFIYSPSLANGKFMREVSGIRRPEISLCRSKT
ncbi:hypothetical protein AMECASPLE_038722 [Ameca splendens]|uniref:Uncharacterized protein n=1 Tax=Ameca splendens TaxID=208324 RepID=A0ABV1AHA2_9TELE